MFICDTCLKAGYLNDPSIGKSRGQCEICLHGAVCSDIPSRHLRPKVHPRTTPQPDWSSSHPVFSHQILRWVTTPQELRRIAAEMEENAKTSTVGTNLTTYVNSSQDDTLALHIVANGDWVNWFQHYPHTSQPSLEEIRTDPRFDLIMSCLWLDIEEMANRFNTCKHDYAEGARAAAAYVLDHWKHGDHLKLIKEKDIKDRLSKLRDRS